MIIAHRLLLTLRKCDTASPAAGRRPARVGRVRAETPGAGAPMATLRLALRRRVPLHLRHRGRLRRAATRRANRHRHRQRPTDHAYGLRPCTTSSATRSAAGFSARPVVTESDGEGVDHRLPPHVHRVRPVPVGSRLRVTRYKAPAPGPGTQHSGRSPREVQGGALCWRVGQSVDTGALPQLS